MSEKEKEAEKKAFLFFFLTYSLLTKHDPFVNFVKWERHLKYIDTEASSVHIRKHWEIGITKTNNMLFITCKLMVFVAFFHLF